MEKATSAAVFREAVLRNVSEEAGRWFRQATDFSAESFDRNVFAAAFSAAARKLPSGAVRWLPEEAKRLTEAGRLSAPPDWDLATAGRAAMILTAAAILPEELFADLMNDLFYRGDNREKQAVLRTMILTPSPARFTPLALDACRTSVQTVFEAIACDNPFPAAHFNDLAFNQMVLKALFTGSPLERIAGFQERLNAELVRMASDYAAEREAAGREVPPDIRKIIEYNRSNP